MTQNEIENISVTSSVCFEWVACPKILGAVVGCGIRQDPCNNRTFEMLV